MLIETTTIRGPNKIDPNEGTLVNLPNYDPSGELIVSETHYRFGPRDGDPRHCCNVVDAAHVKMLLAVRCYREVVSLSDSEKASLAGKPRTVPLPEPRPRPAGVPNPIPTRPLEAVAPAPPDDPIEDLAPEERMEPEGPLDRTWLEQATVTEIQTHCKDLSNHELTELEEWEMDNKERRGVFNAIKAERLLRQDLDGDDGATAATA
ncbi:MAG: hypothetical protein V3V08_10890 [Nannocystaceae bacterium]